jgi:hypothetical protein
MPSTKKFNLTLMNKKKLKFFFSLFFFLIFFFITYFVTPKLLNFSLDSIKENLKNNNNINISNISKVEYKIFPTPRLSIPNSNFTIGEDIIDISNSKLELILNISQILNFKKIDYKKLIINRGSIKINLDNINQLLPTSVRDRKKLAFRKSNLVFFHKNKFFFEITDALIKVVKRGEKKELNINGNFLNNEIFIKFNNLFKNKNSLTLKIPKLDIRTKFFFEKDNSDNYKGSLNLEVFNNFLKFDFIKNKEIKLINGFARSKLVNTALEGKIAFKPNFFSNLNFKISNLNIEKLLPYIQKTYFSKDSNNLSFIKKINGVFNFKSKFEGRIINKNGEVKLENFKVGKNKSFFLNANIIEFGKKGKVQFSLIKTVKYKKNLSKKIEIIGLLIPSNSKVIFEKILLNDIELTTTKTKEYENMFKNELIKNSLANILNEGKIEKFLKDLL